MGSNKKSKNKEKDSRKRHRSRSSSVEIVREKEKRRHHHHKRHHHKDKKHKSRHHEYDSEGSDAVLAPSPPHISQSASPPPPPTITIKVDSSPEHSADDNDSYSYNSGGGGAGAESLSIEETNRLRAKLGLKPLQVDNKDTKAAEDGKRKDNLGEFYHKPATNIAEKLEQEKIRNKIAEHREKRKFEAKLSKTKTLADSDSEDDIEAWIEKNRRVQLERQQAAKRAKMLEELDEELGVGQLVEAATREARNKVYTQKNLQGLRVEHDVDAFKEGATEVLTLKDKPILEDDEDVLVNVSIIDNERYKKNIERKKYKLDYNPYDNEEVDEYGMLKRKELLSKYDEEIEGEKKNSFVIGNDNATQRRHEALQSIKAKLENKRIESLALPELRIASDYYSESELVKFKKPKKKVRKIRQKGKLLKADELEAQIKASGANDNDYLKDLGSRRRRDNENYLDIDDTIVPHIDVKAENIKLEPEDNELEMALDKARKLKQQEPKAPISILDAIKREPEDQEMPAEDAGNIVLNSTAEFCRTLGDIPTYGRAGNRDEEEDLLDFERELKDAKIEPEVETSNKMGGSWVAVDTTNRPTAPSASVSEIINQEAPILDEEPDVGSGVAAALRLAMSKGYLDKEDTNRPSTSRLAHLQAKNYSIEDKSHGDEDKFGRRDRYSGPTMEFKEKDAYKPNVKLDYIDDEGHVLNAKEAFRYLSHKFHGKGPGKNKIEKRLKKQEQEGLMKKMSSTDTPLGTLNMLQAKQKETQSPYIVLSGSKHTHSTTISKMKTLK